MRRRADNHWGYDYLPKLDKLYDMLQVYELMHQGKINGYLAQGFNPLAAAPNKAKMTAALSKLKFLVIMDPLVHRDLGVLAQLRRAQRCRLQQDPDGSVSPADDVLRRGRRRARQLGTLAAVALERRASRPARRAPTSRSWPGCSLRLRELYQKRRRRVPRSDREALAGRTPTPNSPTPEELAKEYSGKALADLTDPKDATKIVRKAGEQLAGFGELRDDGSTASGCWIFCGAWGPTGNLMARRDNSDPTGIGQTLNWAWSWPANRRMLYNRASCDPSGKPFNPQRKLIAWDGKQWSGVDMPDFKVGRGSAPSGMGPFIMNAEGVARFFARDEHGGRPVPRALRAVRNAARLQPAAVRMSRGQPAIRRRACSRAIAKRSARPRSSRTWRPPIV